MLVRDVRLFDLAGFRDRIEPQKSMGKIAARPLALDIDQPICIVLGGCDPVNQRVDPAIDRPAKRTARFFEMLIALASGGGCHKVRNKGKKPFTCTTFQAAWKSSR